MGQKELYHDCTNVKDDDGNSRMVRLFVSETNGYGTTYTCEAGCGLVTFVSTVDYNKDLPMALYSWHESGPIPISD